MTAHTIIEKFQLYNGITIFLNSHIGWCTSLMNKLSDSLAKKDKNWTRPSSWKNIFKAVAVAAENVLSCKVILIITLYYM